MNNFKIKSTGNVDKKTGPKKPVHNHGNKNNFHKKNNFSNHHNKNNGRKTFTKFIKKNTNIEGETVRVITIGGFEEVGSNMYAVEYKDNIWIFDMGFQFVNEVETPGIDFMLPNIKYLEERKQKIKGVIITHGHLDHIGGIPFLMQKLGNPPMYTRELTSHLIRKRMEEFKSHPALNITLVAPGDQIKIGDLSFEFFNVTHSIPDSMGILVKTPHGQLVFTGDLKLRHENGVPVPYEEKTWSRVGEGENILMISDSTNCENPGWSIQEKEIEATIADLIRNAPSRVIIATFGSQFERMFNFIQVAENLGKKVVLEGRSVRTNLDIARESGYFVPKKDTIISAKEIDNYPSDRILIISTGGQGEEFAALPRMARKDHPFVQLNERDTVILSSSVIPGNEIAVRGLLDLLARTNAKVITYRTSDVHSTGHGNAEELGWIIKKSHPKYFIPGYGFHSMLKKHKEIAIEKGGVLRENVIVPDNGSIIEIKSKDDIKMLREKVPASPIMVDGTSIMQMNKAVLDDRKNLSTDGFVNIVVLINMAKRKIQKSPDILSRGFIYLRDSQDILNKTRQIVSDLAQEEIEKGGQIDVDKLKENISKKVYRYLTRETGKNPIIIPVVLVV